MNNIDISSEIKERRIGYVKLSVELFEKLSIDEFSKIFGRCKILGVRIEEPIMEYKMYNESFDSLKYNENIPYYQCWIEKTDNEISKIKWCKVE